MTRRQDLLSEISREEARRAALGKEIEEIESRLTALRQELISLPPERGVTAPAPVAALPLSSISDAAKMFLFRSLFRGREDVFPWRWENPKKDTSGYSPACANEWKRDLCDKKHVKCGECPNREFVPVSDQVILDHFKGRHTIGVYPMLSDETCWFLALPISWKGTLIQYTGRLHRIHPGKTEVRIFDYVDRAIPMLLKMFEKRLRGYRAIGYARDEAPLGFAPPPEEPTIEWNEEVARHFKEDE